VLFDLDDTILDSYDARIQALQAVFTQVKIVGITAEKFLSSLQGTVFKEALERLAESQNIQDDLFISYRRAYWFKKPGRIRLYPGIGEMLDTLKSRGYKLGIVTNKGRDLEFEGNRIGCINELKEVGIADLFSAVIGFEDVSEQKPHPAGINLALNQIGSQPQDTLFIGDSAADIEAANTAGCRSCQALWGVPADSAGAENITADFIAAVPDDVIRILEGI
jgi:pyrophosphatase PpaX